MSVRPVVGLMLLLTVVVATSAAIVVPKAQAADPASPDALAAIRQTLDRAERLLARLRPTADARRIGRLAAELAALRRRLDNPAENRERLAADLARVKRQIAFCNPRLNFDKLLFVKRHDAGGVFHMCDQFYGCNAKPGGGLFVLHDPFGPKPRLEDLLANSVVVSGRLKGQKLEGGAFLAPDLSFDGREIVFAYTQATAYEQARGKECYLWGPEISYHIFKVHADGTHLVQLTDGDGDDFDPCFLPDGRIAFISMRRGGYLRCGRHCPVYTLFAMQADGSQITCLSHHETHEWQPSVTNDGMLVYTRWDYVDRDTNVAHHIWTCYPDGRDPRSFHGNYPLRRESRPWMEMQIRAIPDSPKFVAVAAAHHGHAFGSLVLIDPRKPDDGAMSQLERLTPEVPFPEAEEKKTAKAMVYGTPWPLSETDFLCAYDPAAKRHAICWIDRDGNRELICGDAAIACLDPIPLRPRPAPPIIPPQSADAVVVDSSTGGSDSSAIEVPKGQEDVPQSVDPAHAEKPLPPGTATVALVNVYDSDFTWPGEARVTALRVIQVLPKTTAPPNEPRIGVANQSNARAVLGTVPVEADGSAYFAAPPGKEIYFQALDDRGRAIQSMRSGTYLHPGERLVCQGCHEPKDRPPRPRGATPLALRRGPSLLSPEVEGSNPFSYVRLVQPVLDRNCVECHRREKALDLGGTPQKQFTTSYNSLARKYGFYYDVGNGSIRDAVHGGSRTPAGKFGATAAPLLKYLDESHYGVRLSPADLRRITLWLDCNSEFYGAYENTAAQQRGTVVKPSLD